MIYSLAVKTEPTVEPVSLAEAKLHLRIPSAFTGDDLLIASLITGGRLWAENQCRRSFVQRTLQLRMDSFPCGEVLLPRGPVISIASVTVLGAVVAASTYESDLYAMPARLKPVFGAIWPVIGTPQLNAVVIEYDAGYAHSTASPTDLADKVPDIAKAAIKLWIEAQYDRDPVMMEKNMAAARNLLASLEVRDFRIE